MLSIIEQIIDRRLICITKSCVSRKFYVKLSLYLQFAIIILEYLHWIYMCARSLCIAAYHLPHVWHKVNKTE